MRVTTSYIKGFGCGGVLSIFYAYYLQLILVKDASLSYNLDKKEVWFSRPKSFIAVGESCFFFASQKPLGLFLRAFSFSIAFVEL